jgi:polyisoprenyl-phosphate glycosyltransferase
LKVSIIIPAFNEETALQVTLPAVFQVLSNGIASGMLESYEILVIDDGSTDKTIEVVKSLMDHELLEVDCRLRLISMRGNQGHMKALEAGYNEFLGDCVITMDADMQDPPSALLGMLSIYIESKVSCVQAVRTSRTKDSLYKRTTASAYYFLVKLLTGVNVTPHAADFRLLSREDAKLIAGLKEHNKIYRLLIHDLKIPTKIFEIQRDSRVSGKSKYTNRKMLWLALDSILSFSVKPLRITLYFGMASLLGSFSLGLYFIVSWIKNPATSTHLVFAFFFIFGYSVLMISLAIIGEYIGRIYFHILDRPKIRYVEIEDSK